MTSDTHASGAPRPARRLAVISALLLLAVWMALNFGRLLSVQSGAIQFTLGLLFAGLVTFRPKPREAPRWNIPEEILPAVALVGTGAVLAGIVLPVHQLEWLGLLLLLFACLGWGLPARYRPDLLWGLLLLYWVHPLPAQVFGPLQLAMQRLSVICSEALLHIFNVRVWADGLVLRTGLRVFGVPEACSGLKTAVTVLLCGIGVGLLFRLRVVGVLAVLVAGLVQVLALNILRIAALVRFGADKPPEWSGQVLHDTMGIFMLVAVALVHVDAVIWRNWEQKRRYRQALISVGDEIGEPDDRRRKLPRFWRVVATWWWLLPAVAAPVVLIGLPAYKLRPAHRAEMISGVVRSLRVQDPEAAERAARYALRLNPRHPTLRLELAAALFDRGKHAEALAELTRKPVAARSLEERMLEARILLELKRYEEVRAIADSLAAQTRETPGVAMLLAELAAVLDRPAEVAANVLKAARLQGLTHRIRELYPYMAARELWAAIRDSDSSLPYRHPVPAVVSATARLKVNDAAGAARVLDNAWTVAAGAEELFLTPMLALLEQRADPVWEERFAQTLRAKLDRLTEQGLATMLEGCFAIHRADLAWLVYRRLAAVAPDAPELHLAPVMHGEHWFEIRRGALGFGGAGDRTPINLRSFLRLTRHLPGWRALWQAIPLAELGGRPLASAERERRLRQCLEALQRLERAGELKTHRETLFVQVLGTLGRWDEAHAKLNDFERRQPERRPEYLLQHGALYLSRQEWEPAYESFSEHFRLRPHAPLKAWQDFAATVFALNLGPYAMGLLEEGLGVFPEDDEMRLAMARLYAFYGFAEEALFLVNRLRSFQDTPFRVALLAATGRVNAARRLAAVEKLPDPMLPQRQAELLAPAEWSLQWRVRPLTDADYTREAARAEPGPSPFVAGLRALRAEWFRQHGGGTAADAGRWEALGRDARERGMALVDLAMLLGRQGRTNEAERLARRAVELVPTWSTPWRVLVALSGGAPGVVEQAHQACPWEPELWLARLVTRVRSGAAGTKEWALAEIRSVADGRRYSPGILARAADFLVRQGHTNAATVATRAAIRDGEGLLAAYVVGLRCAVTNQDITWAIQCALDGAEHALEPWPFYKLLVALKAAAGGPPDADVVRALEALEARFPSERQWAETLGEVYFRRGESQQALQVLEKTITRAEDVKQLRPRSLLLAAEAARLEGRLGAAVRILEAARAAYPDDVSVLNNLVYTLAQDDATIPRARQLLPELLKRGADSFAVHDTAAIVSLRGGDLRGAEEHMARALALVKKGDYAWHEVYLNAAETLASLGRFAEARAKVELVRKSPQRSPAVERRARELLEEITRREREKAAEERG